MLEDLTPEEQEIVQGVIQGIYGSQGQSNGQLRKIEETPI